MENFKKFMKQHAVLLLSIGGGLLLLIVVCGFAFGRHDRDGRFERGFGSQMGCGMEKWGRWGEQWCSFAQWKWWAEAACPIAWWAWGPGMIWGPGIWCDGEWKMQEHMCSSWSLQSGATQQLLISVDMKINNLNLIKTNMQSLAKRTATDYSTGELVALDDLIARFDAQRKILESDPTSFCTESDTWKTLNEDMRKIMMEGISGQVNKFKEGGKRGMGMMWRWFGR